MKKDIKETGVFRWSLGGLALVSLLALPMLVMTGCAESNPMLAENDRNKFFDQPYSESDTDELAGNALFKTLIREVYTGKGRISSSNGGTINIGGLFTFNVPSQSISEDTEIGVEVTLFIYDDETIILHKFSPDGLEFKQSASLEFSVELFGYEIDQDTRPYWLNPETNHWDWLEDIDHSKGLVSIPIDHFSMYGVE